MRGRMRRYGVIHHEKYLDPNGYPITLAELLLDLYNNTYQTKGEAVKAAREINEPMMPGDKKAYAAIIWIDVSGTKSGKG